MVSKLTQLREMLYRLLVMAYLINGGGYGCKQQVVMAIFDYREEEYLGAVQPRTQAVLRRLGAV